MTTILIFADAISPCSLVLTIEGIESNTGHEGNTIDPLSDMSKMFFKGQMCEPDAGTLLGGISAEIAVDRQVETAPQAGIFDGLKDKIMDDFHEKDHICVPAVSWPYTKIAKILYPTV